MVSHLPDFQEKPRRLSEELIPLRKVMEAPKALHSVIKQTERAFADGHPDPFGRVQADWRLPHISTFVSQGSAWCALSNSWTCWSDSLKQIA